jgi:hypothetical protein
MPTMAPTMVIQTKKKRAISSVQMLDGIRWVKREKICRLTGTISTATAATSRAHSSR